MTKHLTLRLYRSHRQLRWTLYARNGRKLANGGEGYHNKADLKKAITLVLDVTWREDITIKDEANLDLYKSVPLSNEGE